MTVTAPGVAASYVAASNVTDSDVKDSDATDSESTASGTATSTAATPLPASRGRWVGSGVRITGLGHYYPRNQVRNPPPADLPEGNRVDKAVVGDVGVLTRHVSDESETVVAMGVSAVRDALLEAGRQASDLDLLILVNWTSRSLVPELAPQITEEIGAEHALAFDLCGACTGFILAVQTVAAYLVSMPEVRCAAVVCSEQMSQRVRPGSKGVYIVGDAAGAAILERRPPSSVPGSSAGHGESELREPEPRESGLIDSVLSCRGREGDAVIAVPPEGWLRSQPKLVTLAVEGVVSSVHRLLERNGLTIADIDWVVPHPGSDTIHRTIRDRLGVPAERFVVNFETRANTSSASIPIVLSEFTRSGRFRRGDLFLAPAIGSGLYQGGLLFRL
jgi:3-oxoacyl-[acyl-carrier-protein] synthase-3